MLATPLVVRSTIFNEKDQRLYCKGGLKIVRVEKPVIARDAIYARIMPELY